MNESKWEEIKNGTRFAGPHAGGLAIVYTILTLIGLYCISSFSGGAHYPGTGDSAETITGYFSAHSTALLVCSFFELAAAITLGVFTATIVSQMRFLRVRAAGPYIALFGGVASAIAVGAASCLMWVSAYPGIATTTDMALSRTLYFMQYIFGGVGFAIPFAVLVAGISIAGSFTKTLPKWIVGLGVLLMIVGGLSWFSMFTSNLRFLVPLTRFPGMLWAIAAGFALPRTIMAQAAGLRPQPVPPSQPVQPVQPVSRAA